MPFAHPVQAGLIIGMAGVGVMDRQCSLADSVEGDECHCSRFVAEASDTADPPMFP
jgi:hypothetical protein